MCGIYGITERNPEYINSYIRQCSHRGPDGSSIWYDDDISIGHNLLAITSDPEQGKQPVETRHGVLTYNGEIFNYKELIKESDWQPQTTCDTEYLSYALSTMPHETVNEKIDSMHAYAYYNKARKHLILSRDHAGIKPLYYAEIPQGLVFGSEIKGMINKVPNGRCIDEFAAAAMSYSGINATRNTLFKNIKKVMPGETLVYDVANKRFIQSYQKVITPTSKCKLDLDQFRHEAHETVKMSTLGIRKFGMFLSGGLDSTLVAYELKKILGELDSFTNKMSPNVKIGEDFNDDANCAKKFAEEFKLNHHSVIVTPDSVKANWDASMHTMEQPVYNMSIPMYYQTNKYLSAKGVVVTMAGDMGDELLGGYPKYWKLRNDPPKSFEDMIWKWMHRIKRPVQLTNKINPKDIHAELCKVIPQDVWNPEDPINSYMAVDCITQVPEEFFSRNDKFGMQFSMEGRFPLATKRFMTYCMDMHSQYKIGKDKSDTKLPTKLAYKGHMPDYIINKMKTGWTVPLMYWLGTMKELNDWAMSYMLKEDCLRSQISMKNWDNKKTRVVSWMMRSWAQIYDIQS